MSKYEIFQKQGAVWVKVAGTDTSGNYLPLAGGDMTGTITLCDSRDKPSLQAPDDKWAVRIEGGKTDGASLILYGKEYDYDPGTFYLGAYSEDAYGCYLYGNGITKKLKWDGKDVLTSEDIINTLMSTSTVDALSANQGKILNDTKQSVVTYSETFPDSPKTGDLHITWTTDAHEIYRYHGTGWTKVASMGDYLYLPFTGGRMTGNIYTKTLISQVAQALTREVSNSYLEIYGGAGKGASLSLRGDESTADRGIFALEANDGSKSTQLQGIPGGSLWWGDSRVVTESNTTKLNGTSATRGWGDTCTVTTTYNLSGHTGLVIDNEGVVPIIFWSAAPSVAGTKFTIDSWSYGTPSQITIKCTTGNNQFSVVVF